MTKEEIILANKEFLFPAVFHYYKEPLVVARAKDQYVWDADGNQYLDFFGGIVTVSVGHCNDQVNAKVHAADRYAAARLHASSPTSRRPRSPRRSPRITPGGKLTKVFFTNSGTEANETAILTARCYTGNDRDRRAAPLLSRPLRHGHDPHRSGQLAARPVAGRRRPRAQRLLLPLPLRPDLSRLRSRAARRTWRS